MIEFINPVCLYGRVFQMYNTNPYDAVRRALINSHNYIVFLHLINSPPFLLRLAGRRHDSRP